MYGSRHRLRDHANWHVRLSVILHGEGVRAHLPFYSRDYTDLSYTWGINFLIDPDWDPAGPLSPKPAVPALAVAAEILRGAEPVEKLTGTLGSNTWGYAFLKNGVKTQVVWTPDSGTNVVTLDLGSSHAARIVNIMGGETSMAVSNNAVTLNVGPSPVYVTESALTLSVPASLPENVGSAGAVVMRNVVGPGSLAVTLSSSDTNTIAPPASVTIPDGTDRVDVVFSVIDDPAVNGGRSVVLQASAGGYGSASNTITVTDCFDFLPFTETFETNPPMAGTLGPVDGQHGWEGDAGAVVQAHDACEFYQAAGISNAALRHGFSDGQSNVWTAFYWKPACGSAPATNLFDGIATAVFWVNDYFELSAYSNQIVLVPGIMVDTGRWSRVLVHNDYAGKRWNLWLDGVNVVEDYGFYSDSLSALSAIECHSYNGAVSYVDDIRVGTNAWNPAPGDTDGDNMADEWERNYWLSCNVSDGTGDWDGDGWSDASEAQADTDPTDSLSHPPPVRSGTLFEFH